MKIDGERGGGQSVRGEGDMLWKEALGEGMVNLTIYQNQPHRKAIK